MEGLSRVGVGVVACTFMTTMQLSYLALFSKVRKHVGTFRDDGLAKNIDALYRSLTLIKLEIDRLLGRCKIEAENRTSKEEQMWLISVWTYSFKVPRLLQHPTKNIPYLIHGSHELYVDVDLSTYCLNARIQLPAHDNRHSFSAGDLGKYSYSTSDWIFEDCNLPSRLRFVMGKIFCLANIGGTGLDESPTHPHMIKLAAGAHVWQTSEQYECLETILVNYWDIVWNHSWDKYWDTHYDEYCDKCWKIDNSSHTYTAALVRGLQQMIDRFSEATESDTYAVLNTTIAVSGGLVHRWVPSFSIIGQTKEWLGYHSDATLQIMVWPEMIHLTRLRDNRVIAAMNMSAGVGKSYFKKTCSDILNIEHETIVELLLENGTEEQHISFREKQFNGDYILQALRETAIEKEASMKRGAKVHLPLEKGNDIKTKSGGSPLSTAAERGGHEAMFQDMIDIVKLFLEIGRIFNIENIRESANTTWALFKAEHETKVQLLQKSDELRIKLGYAESYWTYEFNALDELDLLTWHQIAPWWRSEVMSVLGPKLKMWGGSTYLSKTFPQLYKVFRSLSKLTHGRKRMSARSSLLTLPLMFTWATSAAAKLSVNGYVGRPSELPTHEDMHRTLQHYTLQQFFLEVTKPWQHDAKTDMRPDALLVASFLCSGLTILLFTIRRRDKSQKYFLAAGIFLSAFVGAACSYGAQDFVFRYLFLGVSLSLILSIFYHGKYSARCQSSPQDTLKISPSL